MVGNKSPPPHHPPSTNLPKIIEHELEISQYTILPHIQRYHTDIRYHSGYSMDLISDALRFLNSDVFPHSSHNHLWTSTSY